VASRAVQRGQVAKEQCNDGALQFWPGQADQITAQEGICSHAGVNSIGVAPHLGAQVDLVDMVAKNRPTFKP
jgi:hypothetical protein